MGSNLPRTTRSNRLIAIGLGIDYQIHMTPQARDALQRSDVIFLLVPDKTAIGHLAKAFPEKELIDCHQFYQGEYRRPDAYSRIAGSISDHLATGKNVGIATYGHPMFLVSAVEQALHSASSLGHATEIVPGISSFDTVLSDLGLDLGYGVTILDATLLVVEKIAFPVTIPLLVFQIANFAEDKIERGEISKDRVIELQSTLCKKYGEGHLVQLITSRKSAFDAASRVEIPLSELATTKLFALEDRPTLYVPSLGND